MAWRATIVPLSVALVLAYAFALEPDGVHSVVVEASSNIFPPSAAPTSIGSPPCLLFSEVDFLDQAVHDLFVRDPDLSYGGGELLVPLPEKLLVSARGSGVLDILVLHDALVVLEVPHACFTAPGRSERVDEPTVLLLKHGPGRAEDLPTDFRQLLYVPLRVDGVLLHVLLALFEVLHALHHLISS